MSSGIPHSGAWDTVCGLGMELVDCVQMEWNGTVCGLEMELVDCVQSKCFASCTIHFPPLYPYLKETLLRTSNPANFLAKKIHYGHLLFPSWITAKWLDRRDGLKSEYNLMPLASGREAWKHGWTCSKIKEKIVWSYNIYRKAFDKT